MSGVWNGMIRVELTSADPARTLSAINDRHIGVYSLDGAGELTVCFWVRREDYQKLMMLCQKRGDELRILKRRGFYWVVIGILRRPLLVAGVLLLAAVSFFLPSRVLFVRAEGNSTIPSRRIIAAAEDCGVGFGASRRYVRSEKVKNELLGAIPELQWAGVNTSGCTAVISVRERSASQETLVARPMGIIADRDGFILSADVTRGTALVSPGQTVRKGQTLISGFTDCGLCIRATGAEGEIFAQTKRDLTVVSPSQWLSPQLSGEVKRKISLLIRKKRINLWKDSGICDATCGRMYKEFYITLPGGFQLPFALCIDEYRSYETSPLMVDSSMAEIAMAQFSENYLQQTMISGKIFNLDQLFVEEEGLFRMEGVYDCSEMIGRAQQEQIGETNGKRD